jgi:hypothetical protein
MPDVVTGNVQVGATKQDIIAAMVSRELKEQSQLLGTVLDVSAFAVKGSKQASFPKTGSLTVENRATATAGNAQALTFAVDTVLFDQRAYISWIVDSVDEYQANVDLQTEYVRRAGTAHARNIDDLILGLLDTHAGYVQAAGIDKTKILNARKWLLKNQAMLADLVMVVTPDDEALLLDIAEFVRADAYGNSNIPNGVIGKIYGISVKVHTKADLVKSFIYSKEAVAFGLQKAPQYDEQKKIEYGTGAMLAAVDQLFGLKAMRLTEGKDFAGVALAAGKSPFIAEIG